MCYIGKHQKHYCLAEIVRLLLLSMQTSLNYFNDNT
jgi:hypothetical protein